MQTKRTHSNRDKFYMGRFMGWKDLQNLQFFVNSIGWNCAQYIFISRGAALFIRYGYLYRVQLIKKKFSYFFTNKFWGNVNVNYKSVNKINLVF